MVVPEQPAAIEDDSSTSDFVEGSRICIITGLFTIGKFIQRSVFIPEIGDENSDVE